MTTYAEFCKNIDFRYLRPERKRPHGYRGLSRMLCKVGIHLDMLNTVLPEDNQRMRRVLHEVCKVPKMSTFAIGAMINKAVSALPPDEVFVNVGLWNGFTFLSGMAGNPDKTCIGVDSYPFSHSPREAFKKRFEHFKGPNHHFYHMDYRDYFRDIHTQTIGFYIYDGDHAYEHQLEGLRIAEPFFSRNCIVLVDDTGWQDPKRGTLDFIAQSQNRYEMILDRSTSSGGHPTYWNGIMIFQRVG